MAAVRTLTHIAGPATLQVCCAGEHPRKGLAALQTGRPACDSELNFPPDRRILGIHEGVSGQNGQPIIILAAIANDSFVVPPDARLNDARYASFKAVDICVFT